MVEFLIFQNTKGEILRITAMRASSCAVIYDTIAYHRTQWYCVKVTLDSHGAYWTMRKLILSMHDNIIDRSYVDAMHHVGHVMAKFRVPHWDELIILDYTSINGSLIRQDLIHVTSSLSLITFRHEQLYQSDLSPMFIFLTKIRAIIPHSPQQNVDILTLI